MGEPLWNPSYLDLCRRSTRGEYASEIFYNHQASSDILLSFHGRQIYAHKAVLQKASGVFGAAFSGRWTNATSHQYTIEGFDADVVVAMVKHIYGVELSGIEGHTNDEKIQFLLDVYMIGEEYLITSLQMRVIENIKALLEELYKLKDDDEPLRRSIEAIITLHETYKLRDWQPRYDRESRTLLETTARFCTKWQPRCVEDIWTLSEDNIERFLKRYSKFINELQKAYEDWRPDCVRTDPGCCRCDDYCWKSECYCKRLAGEWNEEFVDMVERFYTQADEDDDEEEAEDEDDDQDDDQDEAEDEMVRAYQGLKL